MGRRRRIIDDGDSDSDGNSSEDNDRFEQFGATEDDYAEESRLAGGFKRRRFTKEQMIYGVFADDDEDEDRRSGGGRRNRLRQGMQFVSATSRSGSSRKGDEDADDLEDSSASEGEDAEEGKAAGEDEEDKDDMDVDEVQDKGEDDDEDGGRTAERFKGLKFRDRAQEQAEADEEEDAMMTAERPGLGSGSGLGFGGASMRAPMWQQGPGLGFKDSTKDKAGGDEEERSGLGSRGTSGFAGTSTRARKPYGGAGLGFSATTTASSSYGGRAGLGASSSQEAQATLEEMQKMEFGSTKDRNQKQKQAASVSSPLTNTPSSPKAPRNVDKDFGKFEKHTKGFGLKYLMKFGYEKGAGLGRDGEGIAKPIDVKIRPKGMSLGYRGFEEATDAVKEQQKRMGNQYDDDMEMEEAKKKASKAAAPVRPEGWKREPGKGKKKKVQYKTAEEIIKEQEGVAAPVSSAGAATVKIIDMTGREARVVSSVSEVSAAMAASTAPPITAAERIPELRHNLRLIVDLAQSDLMHASREERMQRAKQERIQRDYDLSKSKFEKEAELMDRLRSVLDVAKECQLVSNRILSSLSSSPSHSVSMWLLDEFEDAFDRLAKQYQGGTSLPLGLEELVIAAVSPLVKRLLMDWDPLQNPAFGLKQFQRWADLIHESGANGRNGGGGKGAEKQTQGRGFMGVEDGSDDGENRSSVKEKVTNRKMTPYESLLYSFWLPRIRSSINNEWNTRNPDPVIALLEIWCPSKALSVKTPSANDHHHPVIPPWLYDNILTQLIVPKLTAEIEAWDPRRDTIMIHTWLHPWLPILPEDLLEPLHAPLRHKLVLSLQDWHPSDSSAVAVLTPWKDVFTLRDLESVLARSVLPKLVTVFRLGEFTVNPRQQDLAPLQWILAWYPLIPGHLFGYLLETEFFPVWLRVLWTWMSSPGANYEEITAWYLSWKSVFPSDVLGLEAVQRGFKKGLDMMNWGMAYRAQYGYTAPMPTSPPPELIPDTTSPGPTPNATTGGQQQQPPPSILKKPPVSSMSFKDYVEQQALERGLLLLPARGRTHAKTGKPLFRIAADMASNGGLIVHIDDGVVFVEEQLDGGNSVEWVPMSVEDIMDKASATSKGKGRFGR
ncbi:Tuftelin-interacting protein 11 [Quaeritorhiza haematococci]|nr:Tuftelin-interacting protein 11 [Quaeritorhiza haematococci]